MKLFSKIALALVIAISLSACDSGGSNNDNDNNNGGNGTMKATIDGSSWNAASANATRVTVLGISSLTIAGSDASANAMTISLVNVNGPGTYSSGGNNFASASYILSGNADSYIATSGSVTITKIDNDQVEGTFSFQATRISDGADVSITNGSFDVGYGISPF